MNLKEIIELRRMLHQNPEISGFEENTAATVRAFLIKQNPTKIETQIGGHGILASWHGNKPGKKLLFRAELDALPIQEKSKLPYSSIINNVAHLCGHDGHTAILCALATKLNQQNFSGEVSLLFQPAEETGQGAQLVLQSNQFKNLNFNYVFALHNLPGYNEGEIVMKPNIFNAAVSSIIINLKGKTAHAAEPENGINPALAVSQIITLFHSLNNNQAENLQNFQLITPIHVNMGEIAYGVAAANAQLHFTLRTFSNAKLLTVKKQLAQLAKKVAQQNNLKATVEFTQNFAAIVNNSQAVKMTKNAANKLNFNIKTVKQPFKWGEDFGLFTEKFKGCFFGIGSGIKSAALHHQNFDFNDKLIEPAALLFFEIINQCNQIN